MFSLGCFCESLKEKGRLERRDEEMEARFGGKHNIKDSDLVEV